MSCLSWNCRGRGIGNAATVKELRELAKCFTPMVLCVLETQVSKQRVEGLRHTFGYDKAFAVSSSGRSGGLGIFWNNNIKVEISPYSQYHIDAIVSKGVSEPWRLTCVYGEAQTSDRHKTWDVLKFIKPSSPLPWVCIGDFNEVLHRAEHDSVQERSYAQIEGFREMVDVCGLYDLGYEGRSWTFEKQVAGGSYCRVRLDRALATPTWSERFPLAKVRHLNAAASDHVPILLQWSNDPSGRRRARGKRQFRYETMWESHSDFSQMLGQKWKDAGEATTLDSLQRKLTAVAGECDSGSTSVFGNIRRELK